MEITIRHNGVQNLSSSLKRLELKYAASIAAQNAALGALNLTGGDSRQVAEAKAGLRSRLNEDTAKYNAAKRAQAQVDAFVETARTADRNVAAAIGQAQQRFLDQHPWLKPQPEQPWYKKAWDAVCETCSRVCGAVADGFKKAVGFVMDHFNEICLVIGAVALVVGVALTVLSGGTLAAVGALLAKAAVVALKAAAAGAVAGAIIGGGCGALAGGMENGWQGAKEGFLRGAWQGAKEGFYSGFCCGFAGAGLGVAKKGIDAWRAFAAKGGVLSLRNIQLFHYTPDQIMATPRPGNLANPAIMPDDRVKHLFTAQTRGGKHVLSVKGETTLQSATSLTQVSGQPSGVYSVGYKTYWPNSYSPKKVLSAVDESYTLATGGKGLLLSDPLHPNSNNYVVRLSDGVISRICIDKSSGQIKSCFPEGVVHNLTQFFATFGR